MPEEFLATFRHERYRSDDSDWAVGTVQSGETITGCSKPGELHPGIPYRFLGKWDNNPKYGKQFKFTAFVMQTPTSRQGMVAYLSRYLPNIGRARANMLIDRYGVDSVIGMIREHPGEVAADTPGLTAEKVRQAAERIAAIDVFQSTKIELLAMLEGTGVQIEGVMQRAVERWQLNAPKVIREDPFILVQERFPGCGFLTVDKLYKSLGLPLDATRRQVMAVWYVIRSDSSGSTWLGVEQVTRGLNAIVDSGVRVIEAIEVAVENGWVAKLGSHYADAANADAEKSVASDLKRLMA